MISSDSLQVLENEMVQSAITSAHGDGLLIGMIIGVLVMVPVLYIVTLVNKRDNRNKDMITYGEYQIEKEWMSMLDICRDLISRDAQRFEQIGKLFGDLPNMSQEQLEQEFAHMEGLKNALLDRAASRYSEAAALTKTVTRDTEYIARNMADIERKWPKAVREYLDRINKHVNESKEEHENA